MAQGQPQEQQGRRSPSSRRSASTATASIPGYRGHVPNVVNAIGMSTFLSGPGFTEVLVENMEKMGGAGDLGDSAAAYGCNDWGASSFSDDGNAEFKISARARWPTATPRRSRSRPWPRLATLTCTPSPTPTPTARSGEEEVPCGEGQARRGQADRTWLLSREWSLSRSMRDVLWNCRRDAVAPR